MLISWKRKATAFDTYLKIKNPKIYVSEEADGALVKEINNKIDELNKSMGRLWDGGLNGKYGYASFDVDAYVGGSFRNKISDMRRGKDIDFSDIDKDFFKEERSYNDFVDDVKEYERQYRSLKELREELYDIL